MNKIPNIISNKDLNHLEDIFEWNFNISKLANHFSLETNNPIIKNILIKTRNVHTKHCKKIKNLLLEKTND
ncbi:MAG: hypothetical protein E7169_02555 [Firmicutes bacterium]|nr:hypothetical protein [Bacillota bacterium]